MPTLTLLDAQNVEKYTSEPIQLPVFVVEKLQSLKPRVRLHTYHLFARMLQTHIPVPVGTKVLDELMGRDRREFRLFIVELEEAGILKVRNYKTGERVTRVELLHRPSHDSRYTTDTAGRAWVRTAIPDQKFYNSYVRRALYASGSFDRQERQRRQLGSVSLVVSDEEFVDAMLACHERKGGKKSLRDLIASQEHTLWAISNDLDWVKQKNGRVYTRYSGLCKELRKHIRIDGERCVEVDLSTSYWCCLASMIQCDQEFARVTALIQSGKFYETLASLGDYKWAKRSSLKRTVNTICLFDGNLRNRLFLALQQLSPTIARIIERTRSQPAGATRLAHTLQRSEGRLMAAVESEMEDNGIPFLSLHDGQIVPKSHADQVKEIIRCQSIRHFGFRANVSVK